MYVLTTLTSALWHCHTHFATFADASQRTDVIALPRRWTETFNKVYNDWQAKKEKKPRLNIGSLGAHGRALLALLEKPCIAGRAWHEIREDIEGFANSLQSHSKYLEASGRRQMERQQLQHPVHQVSTNVTVQRCMCHTARNPQVPATGRQHRQRDETCRTLNDNFFTSSQGKPN